MKVSDEVDVAYDSGPCVIFEVTASLEDLEALAGVLRDSLEREHTTAAAELLPALTRLAQWLRPLVQLEEEALRHVNPDMEIDDDPDDPELAR